MKQFWFQIVALVVVILIGMTFVANPSNVNKLSNYLNLQQGNKKIIIVSESPEKLVKANISIEIADTKEKRSKGLGDRASLDKDSGMLFIFDQASTPIFWMKGLSFPLDIIWIKDDKVVDLITNVPPPQPGQSDESLPRFAPNTEVDKVLEVNAGFVAEKNIVVGDKIQLINY